MDLKKWLQIMEAYEKGGHVDRTVRHLAAALEKITEAEAQPA